MESATDDVLGSIKYAHLESNEEQGGTDDEYEDDIFEPNEEEDEVSIKHGLTQMRKKESYGVRR